MNIDGLRAAFANTNVKAFYATIRHTESSNTDDAYTLVNLKAPDDPARGVRNHHFSDFSKHPYEGLFTTQGGYAAGAPQFIPSTWGDMKRQYGLPDFSPDSQDLGYVGCLVKRYALDDVIAGRFDVAVRKCVLEWSSLPNASESNPNWTLAKAREFYMQHGGGLESVAGTPYEPVQSTEETSVNPMILNVLGPMLGQLIPQFGKLFAKPADDTTPRDTTSMQVVLDAFVRAALNDPNAKGTNTTQLASAIGAVQEDKTLKAAVTKTVLTDPEVIGLLEVGAGGIAAARTANLAMQVSDKPFWFNPAFWVTLMLLPLVYWIVGAVLIGGVPIPPDAPWYVQLFKIFGQAFNQETRSGTVSLVIGMVLGGIVGIWFGTSYGSMRKTELAAEATKNTATKG